MTMDLTCNDGSSLFSQLTWNFDSQPWNGYSTLEAFYNSFDANDAHESKFYRRSSKGLWW